MNEQSTVSPLSVILLHVTIVKAFHISFFLVPWEQVLVTPPPPQTAHCELWSNDDAESIVGQLTTFQSM